jgi:predicted TIM-barrel fold metal-dependent hydrolase
VTQAVVDTHAHIISSDPVSFPHGPLPDWPAERFVDAEKLLQRMHTAGVERAVLVQYSSVHGYDNSYVLATARQRPDRFVAVCTVEALQPEAADQLSACVANGAAGVRLRAPGRQGPLNWLECEPVWQRTAELHVPVCVHFTESVQAEGMRLLPRLLAKFPSVGVVLDHVGNPQWREGPPDYGLRAVLDLARFEQLTLKFTTVNLERLDAANVEPRIALERLVGAFGAERIAWGSDAPNTPGDYTEMLGWMRQSISMLNAADQVSILGGTALRVYPRRAQTAASPKLLRNCLPVEELPSC